MGTLEDAERQAVNQFIILIGMKPAITMVIRIAMKLAII